MTKRTFGIELEVSTKESKFFVIEKLSQAGIIDWSVKYDGSINGWEIVSPPLEYTEENLEKVKKVVQVLRTEVKARATKKCGMHIHHDIKDFDITQLNRLYKLYARYQYNALKAIIDPTRYGNSYCNPIRDFDLSKLQSSNTINEFCTETGTRYKVLNIKSFAKYGTIEFRHHQASTDWLQTLCWLEITKALVETAANKEIELPNEPTKSTNGEAMNQMINELNLQDNSLVVKSVNRSYKFRVKAGDAS